MCCKSSEIWNNIVENPGTMNRYRTRLKYDDAGYETGYQDSKDYRHSSGGADVGGCDWCWGFKCIYGKI